jgi:2-aminoethylphosphonate-pyruvate transaminase
MDDFSKVSGWKDKVLFTPGPLTTSRTVKQAMLRDLGSRDMEFISLLRNVRRRLVELGGADPVRFTAIPMQGSGTFGLEALLSSTIAGDGKILVAVNGAYGRRLVHIAQVLGIPVVSVEYPENEPVAPSDVAKALENDHAVSHVAVVHCETTSGLMNPIREIGREVKRLNRIYLLDAMSSFGAVPIHLEDDSVDYLVSSANKCIEGVPGFSFVLARLSALTKTEGCGRSVSLNLLDQYRGLEKDGQFRFTPPTHAILAFHQALRELDAEGGVEGRAARYRENHRVLVSGMKEIGFKEYLRPEHQGYIITSFYYPDHPKFHFDEFYRRLNERDYIIYPGKIGKADCFRIGSIGRIFPTDVGDLLSAIRDVLAEMEVRMQ